MTTKTKSMPLCEFFNTNGYCTLGTKCKKRHERCRYKSNQNDDDKPFDEDDDGEVLTEICFSFDVCYHLQ